jgi:effector-binding domain-containing protein
MLNKPQIVRTVAQPAAVIRLTVPRKEIRNVMGPAIAEVTATVTAQGIGPAGSVFSHHLRMDPDTFDFEVGVPVTAPVSAACRVKASHLPAATVARTVYHGPYEGLGSAWGEFGAWIAAEGHTPAPDLWECYVAGPETNTDDGRAELGRRETRARGTRGLARSVLQHALPGERGPGLLAVCAVDHRRLHPGCNGSVVRRGLSSHRECRVHLLRRRYGPHAVIQRRRRHLDPTIINLVVFWLFEIPLAYVLAKQIGLGARGVFAALAIAYSSLAVVSAVVFRRGRWKYKQV